jgi:hypothetical protein
MVGNSSRAVPLRISKFKPLGGIQAQQHHNPNGTKDER